jgi:anti-sigma factor RsiW
MTCPREGQVHAYHDGELPAEQRAELEQHLHECGDCAALLAELRSLSAALRAAPFSSMNPQAQRRLEQSWWRQRDRGVLRLAEWLTAAAAAVIVISLANFPHSPTRMAPEGAMAWQTEALIPPAQTRDDPTSDVVAAAEWMANDLSQTGGAAQP